VRVLLVTCIVLISIANPVFSQKGLFQKNAIDYLNIGYSTTFVNSKNFFDGELREEHPYDLHIIHDFHAALISNRFKLSGEVTFSNSINRLTAHYYIKTALSVNLLPSSWKGFFGPTGYLAWTSGYQHTRLHEELTIDVPVHGWGIYAMREFKPFNIFFSFYKAYLDEPIPRPNHPSFRPYSSKLRVYSFGFLFGAKTFGKGSWKRNKDK